METDALRLKEGILHVSTGYIRYSTPAVDDGEYVEVAFEDLRPDPQSRHCRKVWKAARLDVCAVVAGTFVLLVLQFMQTTCDIVGWCDMVG